MPSSADIFGLASDPSSWFLEPATPDKGLVAAVWGEPDRGKTHLALTFPTPIRVFDLDLGTRDLVNKFPGKDIKHLPLAPDNPGDAADVALALKRFVTAWNHMLPLVAAERGTVVIDTATQLWRWVTLVMLADVRNKRREAMAKKARTAVENIDMDDVKMNQMDYGAANNLMASILRRPLSFEGLNAVYIHHTAPVYDGATDTGRLKMAAFKETTSIVPIQLMMYRRANPVTKTGEYVGRVDKFRSDDSKRGIDLPFPSYDLLKALDAAGGK